MIKLTYKQLRHPDFLALTQRIYKAKMSMRSAKRVVELCKKLNEELGVANELFQKLVTDGHLRSIEEAGYFVPMEGAEHVAALEEFQNTPVEINMPRLTQQELFHVELSPSEAEMLGGILDDNE